MSSNIFFTADTHFGHSNIIKYTNRPFKTSDEMDESILKKFNEVLNPGDTLYHLGDVSWSSYNLDRFFGRLNCHQVHLIYGNHDKPKVTFHKSIKSYSDLKSFSIGKEYVVCCHYPMRSWKKRGHGAYHFYGHVHNTMPGIGRSQDVGVDTNNFYPWEWSELYKRLKDQPFYDHE